MSKETEADLLDEAAGGPKLMTREEEELLEALRKLGIENSGQLSSILSARPKSVGTISARPDADEEERYSLRPPLRREDRPIHAPRTLIEDETDRAPAASYHFPKLPNFYGEEGKGEASWPSFKFQVEALMARRSFNHDQIMLGITRALKGNAADVLRRLGTGVTINQVMTKLESTFGEIETKEIVMLNYYGCNQGPYKSVTSYASRLKELFNLGVLVGGLDKDDEEGLKRKLYQGLRPEIKSQAGYKRDMITEYDLFKVELRVIESEILASQPEKKKHVAASNIATQPETAPTEEKGSEMKKILGILGNIQERIDKLEKEKEERKQHSQSEGYDMPYWTRAYRGKRGGRGQRGRFSHNNQNGGRGNYRPRRPLGSTTMSQECFNCHQKGHFARECPKNE